MLGLRMGLKLVDIGKDLFKNSADRLEPLVIFLSDWKPNVKMVDEISMTTALNTFRSPVFSLGFDRNFDIHFLDKLSLNNSGQARTIYVASDLALQLKLFYSQVASPLLSNVTFNYIPGQVGNETTKVHFDTLFSGGELVVAGELESDTIEGALLAHSSTGTKELPFKDVHIIPIRNFLPPILPQANKTFGHLERMWAYKTIKQLLHKRQFDPFDDSEPKMKVLKLALKYSFVTPVTSLVVVKPNETTIADPMKAYSSATPVTSLFVVKPNETTIADPMNAVNITEHPYTPCYVPLTGPPLSEKDSFRLLEYFHIFWVLQLTKTDNGTNLIFPLGGTTNLISLNATDTAYDECTADGEAGYCRHFIHCVLNVFQYNSGIFDRNFMCHIHPKYVGVCCPARLKPVQPAS